VQSKTGSVKAVILAALVIVAAIVVFLTSRYPDGSEFPEDGITKELQVGDLAPDFTVDLLSGDRFTLSENKGVVVFLNFWATWCGPCVAEMPAIQELSEAYAGDVVFIGLNCAESTDRVRGFIAEMEFTYNIGLDESSGITETLYPTNGIPYTLVINAEGIISKIFLGGGEQMREPFEDAITEALKG
jgi:thiol-disulfide isomerase/thioredoxin